MIILSHFSRISHTRMDMIWPLPYTVTMTTHGSSVTGQRVERRGIEQGHLCWWWQVCSWCRCWCCWCWWRWRRCWGWWQWWTEEMRVCPTCSSGSRWSRIGVKELVPDTKRCPAHTSADCLNPPAHRQDGYTSKYLSQLEWWQQNRSKQVSFVACLSTLRFTSDYVAQSWSCKM